MEIERFLHLSAAFPTSAEVRNVFFSVLLIMASQRINYDELFSGRQNYTLTHVDPNDPNVTAAAKAEDPDRKERRGPPPTPVEWAIMAWVAGTKRRVLLNEF